MNKLLCYSLILLVCFLAGDVYADFTGKGHLHTLSESKQVFWNPDCRRTGTCDLKSFSLTTLVHEVWFSDDPHNPTYANGAVMEYTTDSVAALEKYAIVQFVKGCVYNTARNRNGKIERASIYTVASFGENIPLCFPHWVIDSQDTDPVYNSDPEQGRFYLLRWNTSGSYDNRTQKYYGAEKPKIPVVYMTDYPAGAFVTATGVKNTALEFKTCIYKAREVPLKTRRDNINFAKPINCFDWQNVYVYDFSDGKFHTDLADLPRHEVPAAPFAVSVFTVFAALLAALVLTWSVKKTVFNHA